jgi:hypothetical protein
MKVPSEARQIRVESTIVKSLPSIVIEPCGTLSKTSLNYLTSKTNTTNLRRFSRSAMIHPRLGILECIKHSFLSPYMSINLHIHIHLHLPGLLQEYMHIYVYMYVCINIELNIHVSCIHMEVNIHVVIHVLVTMHLCAHIHVNMHVCIDIQVNRHVCIHI